MANDPNNTTQHDEKRVLINDPAEVQYWMQKWNITEEQLHYAVGSVGVTVSKIEVWLRNNGKIE